MIMFLHCIFKQQWHRIHLAVRTAICVIILNMACNVALLPNPVSGWHAHRSLWVYVLGLFTKIWSSYRICALFSLSYVTFGSYYANCIHSQACSVLLFHLIKITSVSLYVITWCLVHPFLVPYSFENWKPRQNSTHLIKNFDFNILIVGAYSIHEFYHLLCHHIVHTFANVCFVFVKSLFSRCVQCTSKLFFPSAN